MTFPFRFLLLAIDVEGDGTERWHRESYLPLSVDGDRRTYCLVVIGDDVAIGSCRYARLKGLSTPCS